MKNTYLLLLSLFFALAAHAQMVLEYEITEAGDSIALGFETVDITIDWGDGSQQILTSNSGLLWHTYTTEGTKTVTINGSIKTFGHDRNDKGNKFLTKVLSWDNLGITSFSYAFYYATALKEVPKTLPTSVSDISNMFAYATSFNHPIGDWDTHNVTNMKATFRYAESFNQPLENWNTENVTNMIGVFNSATNFNQPIAKWNTDSVTNMSWMFYNNPNFDQPIGDWNTERVTDMSYMFSEAEAFNQPIGDWDTRAVKNMGNMFLDAKVFNQPIGNWNTSSVTNMKGMFKQAEAFNQPIGNWNTGAVTEMEDMFYLASSFNQPIGDWDVSSVTNFFRMFFVASSFNQPLDNWNPEKAINMIFMFFQANAFNQSLGNWNISSVKNMQTMFFQNSLCTDNYDATLIGWAGQEVNNATGFDAGTSKYSSAGESARAILDQKWGISDGGLGTTEADKCSPVLSTETFSVTNGLEIYPNPVSDKLYINTTSLSSYAVYNLTGNLLEDAEGSETEIDLSNLPSGIYILQSTSELGIRNQRFSKE